MVGKNAILVSLNFLMYNLGQSNFKIRFVSENPSKEDIVENTITIVGGKNFRKWAYLRCPCGCGDILMLSLLKETTPNWNLKIDRYGRPSITPSIWKTDGCKSHFFIKKGKLKWAVFEPTTI